jgi:hypothetical protein
MHNPLITRWNEGKDSTAVVRIPDHLCGKMRRHTLDILHQRERILEYVVIDALKDEAHRYTSLMKDDTISVIDMATAVWCSSEILAVDFKFPRHRTYIVFVAHDQSLSG